MVRLHNLIEQWQRDGAAIVFEALKSTEDGRLTAHRLYRGFSCYSKTLSASGSYKRVQVIDDRGDLMTFDHTVFKRWIV